MGIIFLFFSLYLLNSLERRLLECTHKQGRRDKDHNSLECMHSGWKDQIVNKALLLLSLIVSWESAEVSHQLSQSFLSFSTEFLPCFRFFFSSPRKKIPKNVIFIPGFWHFPSLIMHKQGGKFHFLSLIVYLNFYAKVNNYTETILDMINAKKSNIKKIIQNAADILNPV